MKIFKMVPVVIFGLVINTIQVSAQGAKLNITQTKLLDFKGWGILPASYDRKTPYYSDGSQAWTDMTWLPASGSTPGKIHKTVCELGFDIARVSISPTIGKSDNTLDKARMQDLKDHLTILSKEGISKYILVPWSPPAYMKSPDKVTWGKYLDRDQFLNPEFADGTGYDYADYFIDVLKELKNSGFKMPMSISIQNEPEVAQTYDGCVYDRNDSQKSVWRAVIKQLRKKLDENGFPEIKLDGPDSSGLDNMNMFFGNVSTSGFSLLDSDAELNKAIGAFAFHTYFTSGKIATFVKAMAKYPEKEVWMHETCTDAGIRGELRPNSGNNQLNWALNDVRRMAGDIVDFRTSYWFFWRGFRPNAGEGDQDLVYGDSQKTKAYYVFQKLWKTTGPGWKVMAMTCDDPSLRTDNAKLINSGSGDQWSAPVDLLTMQSPGDDSTCLMLVNNYSVPKTVQTINGLKGDLAEIFTTDKINNMQVQTTRTVSNGTLDSRNLVLSAYSISFLISHSKTVGVNSVKAGNANNISVFPNPAGDHILIRGVGNKFPAKIFIYDLNGRQVVADEINSNYKGVSVKELNPGIYCIEVVAEGVSRTTKFIRN